MNAGRLLLLLLMLLLSNAAIAQDRLAKISLSLEQDSTIEHIDIHTIMEKLLQPDKTLYLFDVRTKEEFAVSHLPDAIRLDPDMDPEVFLDQYGELLEQDQVYFYCSVGRRSTELAEQVAGILKQDGKGSKPANIKGGIFQWHNDQLPLTTCTGSIDFVHPYNWFWKRLLSRKEMVRYKPDI
jgi:rhodanese-related sulfurtransferase